MMAMKISFLGSIAKALYALDLPLYLTKGSFQLTDGLLSPFALIYFLDLSYIPLNGGNRSLHISHQNLLLFRRVVLQEQVSHIHIQGAELVIGIIEILRSHEVGTVKIVHRLFGLAIIVDAHSGDDDDDEKHHHSQEQDFYSDG